VQSDAQGRLQLPQFAGGVDTAQMWHVIIEDGRVRVRVQSTGYRRGTILGLDDHGDTSDVPQQRGEESS
jgi:hypothetical protein